MAGLFPRHPRLQSVFAKQAVMPKVNFEHDELKKS